MTIQEIIYNKKTTKKYKSHDHHLKEYCKHIGYGASGSFDDKTKKGVISSHLKECKKLEKLGYKNLKFCNGGDDDILIVDHDRKEFGFVEYGDPIKIGQRKRRLQDFPSLNRQLRKTLQNLQPNVDPQIHMPKNF